MENGTHINNVFWTISEMRLADLYKLFLGDFNSRKEFNQEIENIIAVNHKNIKIKHDIDIKKNFIDIKKD